MPRLRVFHASYGCETGCCGHVVELDGKRVGDFHFSHPYGEERRAFAEELAREALEEYAPACLPTIDWSSLDWSEVFDE